MKYVGKMYKKALLSIACVTFMAHAQEQMPQQHEHSVVEPAAIAITPSKKTIVLHGRTSDCYAFRIVPKEGVTDLSSIIIQAARYNPKRLQAGETKSVWENAGAETLDKLADKVIKAEFKNYAAYRLQAQRAGVDENDEAIPENLNTGDLITIEQVTDPEECEAGDMSTLGLKAFWTEAEKQRYAIIGTLILGGLILAAAGTAYLYKKHKKSQRVPERRTPEGDTAERLLLFNVMSSIDQLGETKKAQYSQLLSELNENPKLDQQDRIAKLDLIRESANRDLADVQWAPQRAENKAYLDKLINGIERLPDTTQDEKNKKTRLIGNLNEAFETNNANQFAAIKDELVGTFGQDFIKKIELKPMVQEPKGPVKK